MLTPLRILTGAAALALILVPVPGRGQTSTRPSTSGAPPAATRPSAPDWAPPGSDILTFPDGFDATLSDPRAMALAASAQDAMGGLRAWRDVAALRFAFVVNKGEQTLGRRLHYWDRRSGRHRVEMTDSQGRHLVITQDLATRKGEATRSGKELGGAELSSALEQGYGAWVNDSYWLVMPFKAFDPGVRLAFGGSRTREGRRYHLVKLSFDKVGLTPGDVYHAWINSETRQLDYWSYRLQSMKKDEPESLFAWEDWRAFGDVRLSLTKRQVDVPGGEPGLIIRFEEVDLPGAFPEGIFRAGQKVSAAAP